MKLTHHARLRITERANISKQNQKQFMLNVLKKGKPYSRLKKGKVKNYIDKNVYKGKTFVYENYIIIYGKTSKKVYTIYKIPDDLLNESEVN